MKRIIIIMEDKDADAFMQQYNYQKGDTYGLTLTDGCGCCGSGLNVKVQEAKITKVRTQKSDKESCRSA